MRDKTDNPERERGRRTSVIIAAIAITMLVAVSAPFFLGGEENDEQVLGASGTVTITQTMTDGAIEADIQSAIDLAVSGDKVTVTGSKTDADGSIRLNIPNGVTVVWKAVYKDKEYIELTGTGTFEVADGADLLSDRGDNVTADGSGVHVLVSGGKIVNTDGGDCVHYGIGGVTVTGGYLETASGSNNGALFGYDGGDVLVTGGTLLATGDNGYTIICREGGNVTITGGTVKATGDDGRAIYCNPDGKDAGDVIITGGKVTATGEDSYAIFMTDGGLLKYKEGTVSGAVSNEDGEIEITPGDSGISTTTLLIIGVAALAVICFAAWFFFIRPKP